MSPQTQIQPDGFLVPQQAAVQQPHPNPFSRYPPQQEQPSHRPFSSFMKPQATGFMQPQPVGGAFLQPQAAAPNPFRQSMMFPQFTGMGSLGSRMTGPFHQGSGQALFANSPTSDNSSATSSAFFSPSSSFSPSSIASPLLQQSSSVVTNSNVPARPASTPLTSFTSSSQQSHTSPPIAQPVKTHQTGSKNPFGPVITPTPPVPKQPTLMELAMSQGTATNDYDVNADQNSQQQPQFQPSGSFGAIHGYGGPGSQGGTDMSSIASSFSFGNKGGPETKSGMPGFPNVPDGPNGATTGSAFSSLPPTQPIRNTTTYGSSTPSSPSSGPLKPQITGFAPLKPFKPSSSFGASLLESLPPIPVTSTATNNPQIGVGGSSSQPTSLGAVSTQPTGFGRATTTGSSGLVGGLRPQITGGAANPFRISMMTTGSPLNLGGGPQPQFKPTFDGNVGLPSQNAGSTPFGSTLFGGGFTGMGGYDVSKQQQYQSNGSTSLV